ncbi:hypothetical protein EG829_19525 [bacterium]|nr:hypothetical protein [bacterium]
MVNHENCNWYTSRDQTVYDRVGQQKVFFSHASVGGNVINGLRALRSSDSSAYQLVVTADNDTPPAATQDGTFYEYSRGNPGWKAKTDNYAAYMGNGWNSPRIDFSMDKLCYIDQAASAEYYLKLMADLEAAYPDTQFVYWTMPLTTSTRSDNVLRNNYNNAVRSYAAANDVILFDIADIEAWNPQGVEQTFMYDGTEYQMLYSGYTGDGGHLNTAGSQRAAIALYSLFGLATEPTPEPTHTPIPAALWLFGTGLAAVMGLRHRRR